jgi:hypothetical protein
LRQIDDFGLAQHRIPCGFVDVSAQKQVGLMLADVRNSAPRAKALAFIIVYPKR